MKPILASLLVAPALLAFAFPADEIVFAPPEGTSVTKVFTNTTEMTTDEMTMLLNGEDMSAMAPQMDMTTVISMVVTDQYVAMGEGRPAVLQRSFEELSMEGEMETEAAQTGLMDTEISGSSDLEGTTVVFTWDDDDGEYALAFEDDDADEALLDGIDEDMDLRLFLPADAVSEGDSWRVDNDLLASLLAPGGDLKIVPDMAADMGMGMGAGGGGPDLAQILGEVDGSVMATYLGSREADGANVAAIKIDVGISASNDITDILEQASEDMEAPEGMGDMEITYDYADAEFEVEGEGELLWNLDTGVLHSFEFEGDMAMAMDMGMAMSMMGQDMEMEMSMEMSGTLEIGAHTRSEE